MRIRKGQMVADVSGQGGSVTFWAHGEHTLLGPLQQVRTANGLRLRGYSHWCFPQLGKPPAGEMFQGWPKHGQMRNLDMQPWRSGQDVIGYKGTLHLSGQPGWICDLTTVNGLFEGFDGTPDKLGIGLAITNLSQPIAPRMPVLSALHLYFTVGGGVKLWIGGQLIDVSGGMVGPLRIHRANPIVLERSIGRTTIEPSGNCEWVVVWSDRPDLYLCFEPVFGGAPGSFNTPEGHTMGTLETMHCSVALQFVPA